VAKTGKKRPSGRKLTEFGQREREDDRGRLDFTDYAPDLTLEDEYFGGFCETDDGEQAPRPRPPKGAPPAVAGCEWRWLAGWGWGLFPSSPLSARPTIWGRIWGRADADIQRFRHRFRDRWLTRPSPWYRAPKRWATERPSNGAHPFVVQAWRHEEVNARARDEDRQREFERSIDFDPVHDRYEDLDRIARRLELLEKKTDPNKGPGRWDAPPSLSKVPIPARAPNDSFYARGVLREEKIAVLAQHTERAIQKVWCSRYKPSKKLELKRFPTLKRVASNPLLTKDYLTRGLRSIKDARRAECELLLAQFFAEREKVVCAPEKTAEQKVAPRIGRPPIGKQAMSPVERKRRSRPLKGRKAGRKPIGAIAMTNAEKVRNHRRAKQLALIARERPQTAGQPFPRGRPAVNLSRKDKKA